MAEATHPAGLLARVRGRFRAAFDFLRSRFEIARLGRQLNKLASERESLIAVLGKRTWELGIEAPEYRGEWTQLAQCDQRLQTAQTALVDLEAQMGHLEARGAALEADYSARIAAAEAEVAAVEAVVTQALVAHEQAVLKVKQAQAEESAVQAQLTAARRRLELEALEPQKTAEDGPPDLEREIEDLKRRLSQPRAQIADLQSVVEQRAGELAHRRSQQTAPQQRLDELRRRRAGELRGVEGERAELRRSIRPQQRQRATVELEREPLFAVLGRQVAVARPISPSSGALEDLYAELDRNAALVARIEGRRALLHQAFSFEAGGGGGSPSSRLQRLARRFRRGADRRAPTSSPPSRVAGGSWFGRIPSWVVPALAGLGILIVLYGLLRTQPHYETLWELSQDDSDRWFRDRTDTFYTLTRQALCGIALGLLALAGGVFQLIKKNRPLPAWSAVTLGLAAAVLGVILYP